MTMNTEILKACFFEKVKYFNVVGVDGLTPEKFEKHLDPNLDNIVRKYKSGKYVLKPFKEKLLLKGRDKIPRSIEKPTVSDKVVLVWLNQKLSQKLDLQFCPAYKIIKKIKIHLSDKKYRFFARLDISSFYSSIPHEQLLRDLWENGVLDDLLELVTQSIKNCTRSMDGEVLTPYVDVGIPQGIPISNLLANFYIHEIDREFLEYNRIVYQRFVDDFIILAEDSQTLRDYCGILKNKLASKGLKLNEQKEQHGCIEEGFQYLGYLFNITEEGLSLSVRPSSYQKMYRSLSQKFRSFLKKGNKNQFDVRRFIWLLNLTITGAIIGEKRYGWLFYYSQIDLNSSQLYELDRFLERKLKFLRIDQEAIKSFVRSHFEINKNLSHTGYIPVFDRYSLEDQIDHLTNIVGFSHQQVSDMTVAGVHTAFKDNIFRFVHQLGTEIGQVS